MTATGPERPRKSPLTSRHGDLPGARFLDRLCAQQQTWSAFAKKRGLNTKSEPPVRDDLIARRFTAQTPNQL